MLFIAVFFFTKIENTASYIQCLFVGITHSFVDNANNG